MRIFAEPWEARAFAMVRALQDAGPRSPLTDGLRRSAPRSGAHRTAGDPDTGETYYRTG